MKPFHIFLFISAIVLCENISSVYGGSEGMVKMMKEQFEKLKDVFPKSMKMADVTLKAEGVECTTKDVEVSGMGDIVIEKIDFTEKPSVDIIMIAKSVKEVGKYVASGKLDGKEVKGSGPFNLKLTDFKTQIYLEFNDKKISKFDFKILSKDPSKIDLDLEGLEIDGKKQSKDDMKKLLPVFATMFEKDTMKENLSKELQKFLDDVIMKMMG